MLSYFERHQSGLADGLYIHANVFHFHELTSKLFIPHFEPSNLFKVCNIIFNLCFILQLNIHRFKVIARFGLMHVVATNICVWIRTLVLESLKEITDYHVRNPLGVPGEGVLGSKCIKKIKSSHTLLIFLHQLSMYCTRFMY